METCRICKKNGDGLGKYCDCIVPVHKKCLTNERKEIQSNIGEGDVCRICKVEYTYKLEIEDPVVTFNDYSNGPPKFKKKNLIIAILISLIILIIIISISAILIYLRINFPTDKIINVSWIITLVLLFLVIFCILLFIGTYALLIGIVFCIRLIKDSFYI